MGKVRVLIIDDSAYNRQTIAEILQSHEDIDVVGKASDGEEGLKAAAALKPDLITLDLEMPRMDGFTFLRILMSKLPTPVIVISSHSRKQSVFQALELGALDFIAKPTRHISPELQGIREELIGKVLLFRHLRMDALHPRTAPQVEEAKRAPPRELPTGDMKLICIGASTGGPPAVQLLLAQIPADAPVAVLVCQHMPAKFTKAFAERLDKTASFSVKEAEEGDAIVAGRAYIAPGGRNMIIHRVDGKRVIGLQEGQNDDRYVPSIDKLYITAAETFGKQVLAVVLTGMGTDGKVGAGRVRERGGITIAEAKESAVIYGMPKEVAEAGLADHLLALPKISEAISEFCSTGKIGKKT